MIFGLLLSLTTDGNQVFYNKPQVVNRDLSTLVIQHFIELRKREFATKGATSIDSFPQYN